MHLMESLDACGGNCKDFFLVHQIIYLSNYNMKRKNIKSSQENVTQTQVYTVELETTFNLLLLIVHLKIACSSLLG